MLQKGFTHIVLLFGIALSAGIFIYFSHQAGYKDKIFTRETPLPTYSPERRALDARLTKDNVHRREGSEGPLVFIEQDLKQVNESFHLDITKLASPYASPVSCLGVVDNEHSNLLNVEGRIDNSLVKRYITDIESHLFSDETTLYNADSMTIFSIENEGERSIHQVTFNQICKDDLGYYFIFESLGEKTRIGGGGSAPSHFAYTDFDGELHIIERIPANIKSNIDVPSTYGKGAAYYGCRKIYATNEIEYLIGCGGGDGPAGMSQVFVFRLSDESMHEKAICYYGPESRKICFNRNGEKYYENIGDIE